MNKVEKSSVILTPDSEASGPSVADSGIFVLLCVILVYGPIVFGAVDFTSLGLLVVFAGFILLAWIYRTFAERQLSVSINPIQLPLVGLIVVGLIQLLPLRGFSAEVSSLLSSGPVSSLSLAPYDTRLAVIELVIYLVFFSAALTFIRSHERYRRVILLIIVLGAVLGFYAVLQSLSSTYAIYSLREVNQASPFGTFFNGHHFAAYMVMAFSVALALIIGRGTLPDKRYLLMIAAGLMGIAILFSASRGAFLSLIGAVAAVLLISFFLGKTTSNDKGNVSRFLWFAGIGTLIMIGLFAAVILVGGDASLGRVVSFSGGAEDVTNGRLHFWSIAIQNFLNYPLIGSGLDSYALVFPNYDTWNGTFRVEYAHNDYLNVLSDAGIIGFACVVAFLYLLLRQGLKKIAAERDPFTKSAAIGALAGCLAIAMHSAVDFPLRTPSNAFYFLVLAAIAVINLPQREAEGSL